MMSGAVMFNPLYLELSLITARFDNAQRELRPERSI